ncbi:unnamed protein product [Pseudo-nitzschia multistriata]|uniref:Uncharacterized protein n=1 Tax=Pseudo-nitzschia multistriata TaxID=183589 RepID=A0A448Z3C4_9STRA|nr:unnamed protein product [Pseudo-nitzschia multistriata]
MLSCSAAAALPGARSAATTRWVIVVVPRAGFSRARLSSRTALGTSLAGFVILAGSEETVFILATRRSTTGTGTTGSAISTSIIIQQPSTFGTS